MKVKKMYHICMVDGIIRALIDIKGKPNQYGIPKVFETKDAAELWIKNTHIKVCLGNTKFVRLINFKIC